MSWPTIPGFRIQRVLSEGRRSVLYLAEQESLQRPVALKVLSGEMTADERSRRKLIEQEKSAARLTHPNLIAVYDISEHAGQPYIATEYVTGGNLRESLNGPLTLERSLQVAHDLAQGLVYLHSQSLLHRDIKPTNILFREDGSAVLGASGITRYEDASSVEVSFGSPHYMSPEQAQAQPVDGRSDLYSLGVVLFEMLTGELPFDADDPFEVAIKHINDPLPALPAALGKLQPLVHRLLAKRPDERFANAQQLSQVLEQALTKLNALRTPGKAAPASAAATPRPPRAAPEATVVQAPIDPAATVISATLPNATPDLGATVISAPVSTPPVSQPAADLGATMVSPPVRPPNVASPPPPDLGATVVSSALNPGSLPPSGVSAAGVDPTATVVQAQIPSVALDPGATIVQGQRPAVPVDAGATMVNVAPLKPELAPDIGATMVSAAPIQSVPDMPAASVPPAETPRYQLEAYDETPVKSKAWIVILVLVLALIGAAVAWWMMRKPIAPPQVIPKQTSQLGGTEAQGGSAQLESLLKRAESELARARSGDASALAAENQSGGADQDTALALYTQAAAASSDQRAATGLRDTIALIVATVRKEESPNRALALVNAALILQPDDADLLALKKELEQ